MIIKYTTNRMEEGSEESTCFCIPGQVTMVSEKKIKKKHVPFHDVHFPCRRRINELFIWQTERPDKSELMTILSSEMKN
jgi:hypothetical protein